MWSIIAMYMSGIHSMYVSHKFRKKLRLKKKDNQFCVSIRIVAVLRVMRFKILLCVVI